MLYRRKGERIVEIPNTIVRYATGDGDNDFIFMHILEPHNNGEDFVDSLLELTDRLNVRRYCQVGAMYGSTPHTRPLLASGQASNPEVQSILQRAGVRSSNYEGPTSMMAIATQELVKRGIDTLSALIQLPPYARLEEDHRGQEKLLKLLSPIYASPSRTSPRSSRTATASTREIDRMAQREPRVRSLVKQLEEAYDTEVGTQQGEIGEMNEQDPPRLARTWKTSCGGSSSGTSKRILAVMRSPNGAWISTFSRIWPFRRRTGASDERSI